MCMGQRRFQGRLAVSRQTPPHLKDFTKELELAHYAAIADQAEQLGFGTTVESLAPSRTL